MAQVGILGNLLQYDECNFSSILANGVRFGQVERFASKRDTSSGRQDSQPKKKDEQEKLTDKLNKWFKKEKWDIELPLYNENDFEDLDDDLNSVLDSVRRGKSAPSQGPYFLIGTALGLLLSESSDDEVHQRIKKINITFPEAIVKDAPLFGLLKEVTTKARSVGDALTSLKQALQSCHGRCVILFLSAAPRNMERISSTREFDKLNEAITASPMAESYKVQSVQSCRLKDIARALRRQKPTILHFSGHASTDALLFEDDNGNYVPVELERLNDVMKQGAQNGLRYVVLNACSTAEQCDSIANEVGCVIAMKGAVGDEAAINFTYSFYNALADGYTVQQAFDWAQPAAELLHKDSIRPQIIFGGNKANLADKTLKPEEFLSEDDMAPPSTKTISKSRSATASKSSAANNKQEAPQSVAASTHKDEPAVIEEKSSKAQATASPLSPVRSTIAKPPGTDGQLVVRANSGLAPSPAARSLAPPNPTSNSHASQRSSQASNQRQQAPRRVAGSPFGLFDNLISEFFHTSFDNDPFFNDPFDNMFSPGRQPGFRPAQNVVPTPNVSRPRRITGCDICHGPFTNDAGYKAVSCQGCPTVTNRDMAACITCLKAGRVPCLRLRHELTLYKS